MRWWEYALVVLAGTFVAAILAALLWVTGVSRPRPSPVPVAAEVEVVADSTPALAILYRGEVYTVTDIQLAPDGRTFLAQFRTGKTKGAKP
jgi:hypothetical protein